MSNALGIVEAAVSIPTARISRSDLIEKNNLTTPDGEVVVKLGIDSVSVSEQSAYQLALAASQEVMKRAGLSGDDLSAILYISPRVSERLLVAEGPRLQEELAATNAISMSVTDLGCASSSAALFLAKNLLESNPQWETILIAHGSVSATEGRLRLPVTINGDAGLAVLIGRENLRAQLLSLTLETGGRFWDLFYVDYLHRERATWAENCSDRRRYSFDLSLRSKKLVSKMVNAYAALLGDDYRLVVPNLSQSSMKFYEEITGTNVAQSCVSNLRHLGHLGSVDVFANLLPLLDALQPKEKILMLNNSPVAWSAAVWETV